MAPPSVNTHTHTLDLTHHNVCFRDPIRYTCQLCIPNTHMHAGPYTYTLYITGFPRYRENGKKPGFLKYRLPVGRVPGNSVKMSWTRKNPGEMFWFYQGTFGLSKSSPISVIFRRFPLISSCERCPRLLFYWLRHLM